jgi:hypothetical protein
MERYQQKIIAIIFLEICKKESNSNSIKLSKLRAKYKINMPKDSI